MSSHAVHVSLMSSPCRACKPHEYKRQKKHLHLPHPSTISPPQDCSTQRNLPGTSHVLAHVRSHACAFLTCSHMFGRMPAHVSRAHICCSRPIKFVFFVNRFSMRRLGLTPITQPCNTHHPLRHPAADRS